MEVIIVDDASPDGTQDQVKDLQRIYGEDKVVLKARAGKLGLGSAYIHGLVHCKYEYIILMDARRRPAASPSPPKRLETPEAAGQNRPPQQHRPCPRNLFEHRQAAQRDALDCPTAGFECLNVRGPTLGSARAGAQ